MMMRFIASIWCPQFLIGLGLGAVIAGTFWLAQTKAIGQCNPPVNVGALALTPPCDDCTEKTISVLGFDIHFCENKKFQKK